MNSFVPGLMNTFVPGLRNSFVPCFINSFVPGLMNSFVPGLMNSFVHGLRNSLVPDFINSFVPVLMNSFVPGLKGQCNEIFDLYFFHESNPSGPLINRLKWFFLKNSLARRYSNLKFEKFHSAQANTARSKFFLTSQPFKNLTKKLVLVCIVQLWIRFCFTFTLKARRGLNRQNCTRQNSAQANTARSRIFRKYLRENEFLSKTI